MRSLFLAVLFCFAAAPVFAQDGYMIGAPRFTLTARAGVAAPIANDDLFNFFTDELTLERGDFRGFSFGTDVGIHVHPRVDAIVSVTTSSTSNASEFRDFVETNDEPIRQTTELARTSVTGGARYYLTSRGRSLSRYAYIPTRLTPYVGATAGVLWYKLRQEGDFVDFETLDIFTDFFESKGNAPAVSLLAGGDFWFMQGVALNVDARYTWAKAPLHSGFSDFGNIDLQGWQLTAGMSVRF